MASQRSEVLGLIRDLERLGYTCRQSARGSHWKVYKPGGGMICTIPSTPGDHRWKRNTMHDLSRAGVPAF